MSTTLYDASGCVNTRTVEPVTTPATQAIVALGLREDVGQEPLALGRREERGRLEHQQGS